MYGEDLRVTGLDDIISSLQGLGSGFKGIGLAWAQVVSNHIVERAKANAPINIGDLRSAIQNVIDFSLGSGVISITIIDDVPYALLMHECLEPYGTGPQQLGRISKAQPATIEGGVGGKYIERVIQYHSQRYVQVLEEMINTYFATKRIVVPTI